MRRINVYCPTYHRFNRTKDCVESLILSAGLSSHDVHIYVVDNNSPQEMKDWLSSKQAPQVTVRLLESNVGKGAAVNIVHSEARESDYIISIDGDIVNKRELNWIDMFVDVLELDETVGLVSCDFKEGLNVHVVNSLKERKDVGDYTIKYGSLAIGGPSIMLRTNEWDTIGGYRNQDIYIEDDSTLMRDVAKKLKKTPVICEQAILYHPLSETQEEKAFQRWKDSKARGNIPKDKTENTGFFDK